MDYIYRGDGKLSEVKDTMLRTATFAYNGDDAGDDQDNLGKIKSITDPAGYVTTFVYNTNHDLVTINQPESRSWQFTYYANGLMETKKDPTYSTSAPVVNAVTTYAYYADGRINTITDGLNKTASIKYFDESAQYVSAEVTDKNNNKYIYRVDKIKRARTWIKRPGEVNGITYEWGNYRELQKINKRSGASVVFEYDTVNNDYYLPYIIRLTDGSDAEDINTITKYITKSFYGDNPTITGDENTNVKFLTRRVGPIGGTGTNPVGEADISAAITAGKVWSWGYDDDQNGSVAATEYCVASEGHPDGGVVYNKYTANKQLKEITDPEGHKTVYEYYTEGDFNGYLAYIEEHIYEDRIFPAQDFYYFTYFIDYHPNGWVEAIQDARDNVTTYQYYDHGRIEKIIHEDSKFVQNTYDKMLRLTEVLDENSNLTKNTYDVNGNLLTVENALNEITKYYYGDTSNQIAVKYHNNSIVLNKYDIKGRLIKVINTSTLATSNPDTDLANPDFVPSNPDHNYAETNYVYYENDILYQMKEDTGYSAMPVKTITYDYDIYDQLQNVDNGIDPITYDYNIDGWVDKVTTDNDSKEVSYVHDLMGRTTEIHAPLSTVSKIGYDLNGQKIYEIDPSEQITNFYYDELGRLKTVKKVLEVQKSNGQIVFDGYGRPTIVNDKSLNTNYMYNPKGDLDSITNHRGFNSIYYYDNRDRLTDITYDDGTSEKFGYDNGYNRTWAINRDKNVVKWQYNNINQVTRVIRAEEVTRSGGEVDLSSGEPEVLSSVDTEYVYLTASNQTQIKQYKGSSGTYDLTTRNYDYIGRLSSVVAPQGVTSSYDYFKNGQVQRVTYPKNEDSANPSTLTVDYAYNNKGQLETETYDANNVKTILYNTVGQVDTVTFKNQSTTYAYNDLRRMTSSTQAINSNDNKVVNYNYYPNGQIDNVVGLLDPAYPNDPAKNPTTIYEYDAAGRVTKATDAMGNYVITIYDYDDVNKDNMKTVKTYKVGGTLVDLTFYLYYDNDRLHKVYQSLDLDETPDFVNGAFNVTSYTYYGTGDIETVTDPKGNVTTYFYDELHRQTQVVDAEGNKVKYDYGDETKITTVTYHKPDDSVTNTVIYRYNDLDRLYETEDALGNKTGYEYYDNGKQKKVTDAEGNYERYEYDSINRVRKVYDAYEKFTEYIYNDPNYTMTIKDKLGHETEYLYNKLGKVATTTYSDGKTIAHTFDKLGRVETTTDQNGSVVTNTYDFLNRVTNRSIALGTGVVGTTEQSFEYDVHGRLTKAFDNNSAGTADDITNIMVYDKIGRLETERQIMGPEGEPILDYTVTNTYNTGSIRRDKLTYPGGKIVDYAYTGLNQIDTIKIGAQTLADYDYNNLGQVDLKKFVNGVNTDYVYDAAGRLTDKNATHATHNDIIKFSYVLDKVGNRRYERRLGTTINATKNDKGDFYTYDKLYRLTNVKYEVPGTELEAFKTSETVPSTFASYQDFNLDDVGNRTTVDNNGTSVPYGVDTEGMNEYPSINNIPRSYDFAGNLLNEDTSVTGPYAEDSKTYKYDFANRLVEVKDRTNGTVLATYTYDAQGRRATKDDTATYQVFYVYDGNQIIEERKAEDTVGLLNKSWVYGRNIDEPIEIDNGGVKSYYHLNSLGSVYALTDSTGAVVERYSYDAYGMPTIWDATMTTTRTTSSYGNFYMFTGRQYDEETKLYYYRARYYDYKTGRFLSHDPLGYKDGMNLYTYCSNNPINATDPMGTHAIDSNPDFNIPVPTGTEYIEHFEFHDNYRAKINSDLIDDVFNLIEIEKEAKQIANTKDFFRNVYHNFIIDGGIKAKPPIMQFKEEIDKYSSKGGTLLDNADVELLKFFLAITRRNDNDTRLYFRAMVSTEMGFELIKELIENIDKINNTKNIDIKSFEFAEDINEIDSHQKDNTHFVNGHFTLSLSVLFGKSDRIDREETFLQPAGTLYHEIYHVTTLLKVMNRAPLTNWDDYKARTKDLGTQAHKDLRGDFRIPKLYNKDEDKEYLKVRFWTDDSLHGKLAVQLWPIMNKLRIEKILIELNGDEPKPRHKRRMNRYRQNILITDPKEIYNIMKTNSIEKWKLPTDD